MGVHISVYKIVDTEIIEDYTQSFLYYHTEEQDWFDFIRHSGDRDFASSDLFYAVDSEQEQSLYRPKDFDESREWVRDNVVECNQHRLLEALNRMERDENLVFHFSW